MKYIHKFETNGDFETAYHGTDYAEPWVSLIMENGQVGYNKQPIDYTKVPFTIEALGTGNITSRLGNKTVQYSKNGGEWTTMTSATTIPVVQGDEVQFKGNNSTYPSSSLWVSVQYNVKGNIMSLTHGDGFVTANTANANAFYRLFYSNFLISAGDLKLPATTLADTCYYGMFQYCENLTTAPELPATTLSYGCYMQMFSHCTSLRDAPELPAATLADYCYSRMFEDCPSLTIAPELPVTTLVNDCYNGMFYGCTSLTTAPELPATTLVSGCYNHMFRNCAQLNYVKAMFATEPSNTYTQNWLLNVASSGTFVRNANATWEDSITRDASTVPADWTIETASS